MQLTTAIAGSFREVCEHDLDEVAFLNHGFHLGKELACTDADAAREVMNDIGPDPLRITLELFDEYLDCHFSEAGPGDFFNSMLRWMKKTYPDLSETDYPPFKALFYVMLMTTCSGQAYYWRCDRKFASKCSHLIPIVGSNLWNGSTRTCRTIRSWSIAA